MKSQKFTPSKAKLSDNEQIVSGDIPAGIENQILRPDIIPL
jgi:hypothetical protein